MNTDLISREALKEALAKEIKTNDIGLWLKILSVIDNVPAVEEVSEIVFKEPLPMVKTQKIVKALSKRPKGGWVVQRLQNGFDDVYCPFCNARPTRSEYGYYLKDKFCHECGADMRKGGAE